MKKVSLALFFTYPGNQYSGMQYQIDPSVKTIQNQLVQKFFSQGFIKTNKYFELVKFWRWSRAARTDKGVHALINGISSTLYIPQQFVTKEQEKEVVNKQKLVNCLNKIFPDITFYTVFEVNKKFLMRQNVKTRVYCYICPIKLFQKQKVSKQETLAKINRLCQYFIGTRNYHNYSTGVKAKDPKAKRYMISMSCKIHETNEDWVRFQLHGQSFIYHQIRKMVGGIALVFHQNQPQNFLQNTFFNNIIDIYLAPAQGLFLKSLNFQSYNKGNVVIQKIQFSSVEQLMQKKQKQLEQKIMQQQDHTLIFQNWIKDMGKQVQQKVQPNMDIEQ